jgi:molecular chaperone DnaK (HSP70)
MQQTGHLRAATNITWENVALRPWAVNNAYNSREEVDSGLSAWATKSKKYLALYKKIQAQYPIAEKALAKYYKEMLSTELEVSVNLIEELDIQTKQVTNITISRQELTDAIQSVLERVNSAVYSAVEKWRGQNLSSTDVDEVVLVGGSSKVPAVQATIRESLVNLGFPLWDQQEFCSSVNPEHAVGEGLAIRAAVEMGFSINGLKSILMMVKICMLTYKYRDFFIFKHILGYYSKQFRDFEH